MFNNADHSEQSETMILLLTLIYSSYLFGVQRKNKSVHAFQKNQGILILLL